MTSASPTFSEPTELRPTARASKRAWVVLNLVVGPLVLASYVASAMWWDADTVAGLWGGVPEWARPLYTANMFLAAGGYFAFSAYVLRLPVEEVRAFGDRGFSVFTWAYAAILVASTLWMPLTCAVIAAGATALVPLIYVDLFVVAAGTLTLLAAVVSARPRTMPRLRIAAIVGTLFFALQTVVLDGLVWCFNFSL